MHYKKILKIEKYIIDNNFLTVRDKKSKQKQQYSLNKERKQHWKFQPNRINFRRRR